MNVPQEYSRIYQTNAQQIRIIKTQIAVDIVQFHQPIDAVVQNFRPDGLISGVAGLVAYTETAQILKSAPKVGQKLKV